MKFVFDYTETLCRRIAIDADSLADAIKEIENRIDEKEIELETDDFLTGKLSMPLDENFYPQVCFYGEPMKLTEDMDIIIEEW